MRDWEIGADAIGIVLIGRPDPNVYELPWPLGSARPYVASLASDPLILARLRDVLRDTGHVGGATLRRDEVIGLISDALESGRLVLRRVEHAFVSSAPTQTEGEVEDAEPLSQPTAWIEIELLDDVGEPIGNERYEVLDPTGELHSGSLDSNGQARVKDVRPGGCVVRFPDIDRGDWADLRATNRIDTDWLEITLRDEDDRPVPDAAFEVHFEDGTKRTGRLGEDGFYRLWPGQAGPCKIVFPEIDGEDMVEHATA